MNSTQISSRLTIGFVVLVLGVVVAAAMSAPAAAQTTTEIRFGNDSTTLDEATTEPLVVTDVPADSSIGAYELTLDYDASEVSLTVEGTDRFNVSTDSSGGETTVVGYTGAKNGTGGEMQLATMTISPEADNVDSTVSVSSVETFADVDGDTVAQSHDNAVIALSAGDGDSGDDDSDDTDDDGSTGGTGGSTTQAETAGEESTAPSVEDVREELEQSEPTTQSSTEIVDDDPDTSGVSISPQDTQSVSRINFDNEDASGTVEVTEYDEPPQSVADSVSASISADVSEGDSSDDGAQSSESGGTSSVSVATVADISPTSDSARNSPATVTMTVDRDRLDEDPSDAFIVHERDGGWERLETTVETSGDEEVTLEARTESFSLFAVAELQQESQSGTDSQSTSDTESDDGSDGGADDSGSSETLLVVGVLAVIAVAGAALYARGN